MRLRLCRCVSHHSTNRGNYPTTRSCRWHRKVEALGHVTSQLLENFELRLNLDSFCDRNEIESVEDSKDGANRLPGRRVWVDVLHEQTIEFDNVERQRAQHGKGRETATEII